MVTWLRFDSPPLQYNIRARLQLSVHNLLPDGRYVGTNSRVSEGEPGFTAFNEGKKGVLHCHAHQLPFPLLGIFVFREAVAAFAFENLNVEVCLATLCFSKEASIARLGHLCSRHPPVRWFGNILVHTIPMVVHLLIIRETLGGTARVCC